MTNQDEITTYAQFLFNEYGTLSLNTEETAKAVNRSAIALKKDRCNGIGIPYTKSSRAVKYNAIDIARWIVESKVRVS
jgi:hypothetical protein